MKNILIVDDDDAIRSMLKAHLGKNKEYEIATAENGNEAILAVNKRKPDIILMDLKMPVMDGITATHSLRKNPELKTLPIILLSAEEDKAKWVEAFKAGVNDFIPKPYHKSELLARINTHLKISSLTEELKLKNSQMKNEIFFASRIQKSMLQDNIKLNGLEIASLSRASDLVGGDFFDAWESDRYTHFFVGDICGHGIASALLMSACIGMLRSLCQNFKTVQQIFKLLNKMLCEIVGDSGMFLTLVYAVYDRNENYIYFISAGHNPVFFINGKGLNTIEATGPVLGWDVEDCWEVVRHPFANGDCFFLYTDGLVEAVNKDGEEFGYERLRSVLCKNFYPEDLIKKMFNKGSNFCDGKFEDDITMLAVKKNRPGI